MVRVFTDEEAYEILFNLRQEGKPCNRCGQLGFFSRLKYEDYLWICKKCQKRYSPTAGTMMDKTHNAGAWLTVIWILASKQEIKKKEIFMHLRLSLPIRNTILGRLKEKLG